MFRCRKGSLYKRFAKDKISNMMTNNDVPSTAPKSESLAIALEAMAMSWGPVHFLHDKSKYKSLSDIIILLKKKYILLPTVVVLMVVVIGLVASFTYVINRKKKAAEEKALQDRKAQLLADWGGRGFYGKK
ncbi:hypothetical protein KIN20_009398 [Parelaphostrongylus tenuis]|uniref:Uncharacterized protein n=1 Tax=Parelaphostrongylus tenuis TaxID=148309 RepID=A0AAD5M9G9_PARTN|nr:hypothetical protein KIN20_009398 [Parelaphostrongylus tenuis]